MKIAFDLDGVLIPDFKHIPNLNQTEFYQYTFYAKPLIQPTYSYDVVTARSENHRDITEQWLNQMLLAPSRVIMNDKDQTSSLFKYQMIRLHGYDVYVESDLSIVAEIFGWYFQDGVAPIKILHFDTFVNSKLLDNKY